ncbi:MAG: ABC transporter ATP-binding protein [Thermodesulfobacteriota bacterium]
MLKVNNLDVYYGSLKTLDGVSIRVEERELVSVIGANGAGKSTLLNAIAHIIQPRKGTINFIGRNVTFVTAPQITKLGITLVPEGRQLFGTLTVLENLEIGAYSRYYPWGGEKRALRTIAQDMERVYDLFPVLRERRKQNAGTLSGGEQQMLAIGRALMSEPKLLMTDEPSLGLSPILKNTVLGAFGRLREEGLTILLVEQDMEMSLRMAVRAYVIENGRIVLEGKGAELLENNEVKQHYLATK